MAGIGSGWSGWVRAVGGCVAAALVMASPASADTGVAAYSTGSSTFRVPAGVTSLDVIALGAAGGNGGGMGALVEDSAVPVTPGEALAVIVGAPGGPGSIAAGGAGGFGGGGDAGDIAGTNGDALDGGGGGGASGVFAGPYPLVIAGGGGGGGGGGAAGGNAGARTGENGNPGNGGGAVGGGGGTHVVGGAGGAGGSGQAGGSTGVRLFGGQGGTTLTSGNSTGGGGGGGYYGGGGGGGGPTGAGGGGGSSFVTSGALNAVATSDAAFVEIDYAAPSAGAGPASLNFGTVATGTLSSEKSVTVTNTAAPGSPPLTVGSETLTGANPDDYLIDDNCAPLTPGQSCQVEVRFAPQAQGASSASLAIATNAPTSLAPIALSGIGGPLPQGPRGPTGPSGASGKVELVTCTTIKVHGKTRKKCTAKLVSGTVKFTTATARATLSRGHMVYATGTAVRWHGAERLSLRIRRRLTPGRYTLTVTEGSARHLSTLVILTGA